MKNKREQDDQKGRQKISEYEESTNEINVECTGEDTES